MKKMKNDYPEFCFKICPKGSEKQKEILKNNESVLDAAFEFQDFVDECLRTCPYSEERANGLYQHRN